MITKEICKKYHAMEAKYKPIWSTTTFNCVLLVSPEEGVSFKFSPISKREKFRAVRDRANYYRKTFKYTLETIDHPNYCFVHVHHFAHEEDILAVLNADERMRVIGSGSPVCPFA